MKKPQILKISSWLHGYYHGGLVIPNITNLTNYLEYYDLTKPVLELYMIDNILYISSKNGYSSPFSTYYSNYNSSSLSLSSKHICIFHEFKIALGMVYLSDFNESDSNLPVYYIGTTSDYITLSVCLIMNKIALINNTYEYSALSGFSINTTPISSSIHIYTPRNNGTSPIGATDVYVTTSTTGIRLNITNGDDINLMDYFDQIMSSKFSEYNSTNHSVYINGSRHYFYIITLNSMAYTGFPDPSYVSLTYYDYMKIILAKSCSGADDPDNFENWSCGILDIFVKSGKLYIYPFAVLSIKNLTYHFYPNTSIPYQDLEDLCTDYMVTTYNESLWVESSSEPDRNQIEQAQCGYDAMYINCNDTNNTYWYSPDTYQENIGKCIVTSYSYSYSYSYSF